MWRSSGGPEGGSYTPRGAAVALTCLSVTLVVIVGHPGCGQRGPRAAAASAGRGETGLSVYVGRLARERRGVSGPARSGAPPPPVERLSSEDVFIAVKTTWRYHRPRLELLVDTWISENLPQTYVFTDGEDKKLKERMGSHLIITNCSAAHNRQALSCKMALEYDAFIESGRKWFCHVDDDNYLNVRPLLALLSQFSHTEDIYIGRPSLERPIEAAESLSNSDTRQVRFWFATGGAGFCLSRGLALKMKPWASDGAFRATAESIRLPDDCTVGYIVEALLGVRLTRSALFHSHLENLALVSDVHRQVTLSYGTVGNSRNTVNVKGPFSVEEDPTRFRSVHCLLYPDTWWCRGARTLRQPSQERRGGAR